MSDFWKKALDDAIAGRGIYQDSTAKSGGSAGSTGTVKAANYWKKLLGEGAALDGAGVQGWFDDALSGIEEMRSYNESSRKNYAPDYGGQSAARIRELLQASEDVQSYLDSHSRELADYQGLNEYLSQVRSALRGYDADNYRMSNYYSRWPDQESYARAMQEESWRKKYQGNSYAELAPALEALAEGDEKEWLRNYAETARWQERADQYGGKDYRALSAMVETMEDGEEKDWLREYAETINQQELLGMNPEAADREVRALESQYQMGKYLEERYREFLNNPLLMLTQGDAWREAESQYAAFREKYGSMYALQQEIEARRLRIGQSRQLRTALEEQAALEEYRKGVRNPETIQKELAELEEQMQQPPKPKKKDSEAGWQAIAQNVAEGMQVSSSGLAIQGLTDEEKAELASMRSRRAELERELFFSREAVYRGLMDRADFQTKSQYVPTGNPGGIRTGQGEYVTGDIRYDYINKNQRAVMAQTLNEQRSGAAMMGMGMGWLQMMTADEVGIYNYIHATEGEDAADEYIAFLRPALTARQRQNMEGYMAEAASENPVAGSVLSLAMAPARGLTALTQAADFLTDGKIDQNAAYNQYSYMSSAIRNEVSRLAQAKWGVLGSFGYQTAMSMGDFLIAAGIGHGVSGVPLAIMGSGAAADTVISSKDRGLTDGESFLLGIVAGLAEAATEKWSLEKLLDVDILKSGIAKYVLSNALTEGSEEVASSMVNLFADIIVTQEESEWERAVGEYRNQGYTEAEAFGRAMADQAAVLGMDFLGGALSGGIMSGTAAAGYHGRTTKIGRAMGRWGTDAGTADQLADVLDIGREAGNGTTAGAVAEQLQRKVDSGRKLSAYDKGRLYQSNPKKVDEAMLSGADVGLANPMTRGIDNTDTRWQEARRLSAMTETTIRFYNGSSEENGYYKDGIIYVNTEAEDTVAQVVAHEMTHSTELAESYLDLKRFVQGKLRSEGRDWNLMMRRKAEAYAKDGHPLDTQEDVEAEIIAKYVQDHLLTSEQDVFELFLEEPTVGQRILNWFDRILAKYKGQEKARERVYLYDARQKLLRAKEEADRRRKAERQKPERQQTPAETRETKREIAQPKSEADLDRYMMELLAAGEITEEEYDEWADVRDHDDAAAGTEVAEYIPEVQNPAQTQPSADKEITLEERIAREKAAIHAAITEEGRGRRAQTDPRMTVADTLRQTAAQEAARAAEDEEFRRQQNARRALEDARRAEQEARWDDEIRQLEEDGRRKREEERAAEDARIAALLEDGRKRQEAERAAEEARIAALMNRSRTDMAEQEAAQHQMPDQPMEESDTSEPEHKTRATEQEPRKKPETPTGPDMGKRLATLAEKVISGTADMSDTVWLGQSAVIKGGMYAITGRDMARVLDTLGESDIGSLQLALTSPDMLEDHIYDGDYFRRFRPEYPRGWQYRWMMKQLPDGTRLDVLTATRKNGGPVKVLEAQTSQGEEKASHLWLDRAMEDAKGRQYSLAEESFEPGSDGLLMNEAGEPVALSHRNGSVQFSISTYEESGRAALREYLRKSVSSDRMTQEDMDEMLKSIEEIYEVCRKFKDQFAPFSAWSDAAVVRDTYGRPVFSVVTPNGEYKMNLDFSLVCKKRRTLDAVFNEMSRRGIIDDFELGQKSIVRINEIIRKHGLETACALCFVDARRFRQASVADSFTRLYNELVESLVPQDQRGRIGHFNFAGYETIRPVADGIHTWRDSELDFSHIDEVIRTYKKGTVEYKVARYLRSHPEGRQRLLRGDFMSSQGFDSVKTHNPRILKMYNAKKGTGGPKAAFGDMQYMNEILKRSAWTPGKAYMVGGVRIQSFSDYVPRMVFDYVQMVHDLAAKKLPAHAYTKEVIFARQFGLTGVKINLSLIPAVVDGGIAPGLDANGKYVWAEESFDFEEAKRIQNADGYTENCGTICVGVSDDHIRKLLADPDIRMVIPYHKSGLNPIVAHMNKIEAFQDYTDLQRTRGADGKAIAEEFNFSKELHDMGPDADPRALADRYLKWCRERRYTPKFDQFTESENYYKLLIDFTVTDRDGRYVPQREVRARFPKEGDAFGSMADLIESGLEADAVLEGKKSDELGSIVDEIVRTIPRTEQEISETPVSQMRRQFSIRSESVSELEREAIKTFGTTEDFLEAGFILSNGEMLRFTDDAHRGERIYDHRAIGLVYGVDVDLSVNHGFNHESSAHMNEFVENGGIRFDPGDHELDMDAGMQLSATVPVTKAQEETIRKFIEWKKLREEKYNSDEDPFSLYEGPLPLHIEFGGNANIAVSSGSKDLESWGIKHLSYEGGQINADRIITDIRHFYKTGQIRRPSMVAKFRYSLNTEEKSEDSQAARIRRDTLPSKARSYLAGAENRLLQAIGKALNVPRHAQYTLLKDIVQEISNIYLAEGAIPREKEDALFEKAYASGIVEDRTFYDQYKEIKDHLRSTAVTLSEGDRSDIADFGAFRKQAWGTLRIVNEGGLPVDVAYQELHGMAPELFPESITRPADQLVRMYEVGHSIEISRKNLDEFYGHSEAEREEFRHWARNDFDAAIGEAIRDLRQVKRYAEAQAEEIETPAIMTTEEATKAYEEMKRLRRNVEKTQAKNLLTPDDQELLGRMLKGELGPQHLDPDHDNVKGIMAVCQAKLEYETQCEVIAAYKRSVRRRRLEEADRLLENARQWQDKKAGFLYARETMRRNILDIVNNRKEAEALLRTYFEPVQISEAAAIRFKQQYRDRVRMLELSRKVEKGNIVSEAHAVQLYGEAADNIRVIETARKFGRNEMRDGRTLADWQGIVADLWANNPNLDQQKIEAAVAEFRQIYDELFAEMNRVRVENGYEPVNYRQGYFPHFQPGGDGIMAFFGKALGIDTQADVLPTTINGMTHTFKPGIQWFGNAQERLGFSTAYDAVEGFDRYIEGVASVIHHTENIQKLRSLATQVRYRTSEEGIRKQVDAIRSDTRLTEEEKNLQINAVYEHGRFSLSNFVAELDEYTNLLANKKSKYDRSMEHLLGRRMYQVMKAWENRVGANMIAGNISSALTNFIPLIQAGSQLDGMFAGGSIGTPIILQGIWDTLKSIRSDDGLRGMSDFLTNRRGSDVLVKAWEQRNVRIKNDVLRKAHSGFWWVGDHAGFLMELIDNFTSESIVRAAYLQNLKEGLSEAEAMHQADLFAAGVMADRSKGAMPTIFESRNPLFKAFTQFQLEVNNQFSEVFKDLPRNHREKGLGALALILLKYFLGAWIYNDLYEKLVGRRPALDPVGILNQTVGDLTGYEIPNLFDITEDLIQGEEVSFETEKKGIGEAGANLATEVLGQLPFSAGLTMLGMETDGGRIPAASAIPDVSKIWEAATEKDLTGEQRWKYIQDELLKLAYVLPPFGGGQAMKAWKGVKAYLEGGSYGLDRNGERILQYPVYKDDPNDAFWNLVRAAFLGKNSLQTAQDWVDSGFDSLDAGMTAMYQDLLDTGLKDKDAFDLLRRLEGITDTESRAQKGKRTKMLLGENISGEAKAIVYYGMLATDTEREQMDELAELGVNPEQIVPFVYGLWRGPLASTNQKNLMHEKLFNESGLTEEEKHFAMRYILGEDLTTEKGDPTGYAKYLAAIETGLSNEQYWRLRTFGTKVDQYLTLKDAGLGTEHAVDIAMKLDALEPYEGEDSVSWILECETILESDMPEAEQMAALSTVMYESTYRKVRIGFENGLPAKSLVYLKSILPEFDADGSGGYSQAEVTAAIDAITGDDNPLFAATGTSPHGFTLTETQKAILWQLQTNGKNGKKNPYDPDVGKRIYDLMNAEETDPDAGQAEKTEAGTDLSQLLAGLK